jgi:hypothetical protein
MARRPAGGMVFEPTSATTTNQYRETQWFLALSLAMPAFAVTSFGIHLRRRHRPVT